MEKKHISAAIILIAAAVISIITGRQFLAKHYPETFYPSPGLTRTGKLSDYFSGLQGTENDSRVYFFEGEEEGSTVLLLGGTHPNEAASGLVAVLVLENVEVTVGRLIVIPRANRSGFTVNDPMEAHPQYYSIPTPNGERRFKYGSRLTSPLDQWPDPLVYSHRPSGQRLSGFETRNLNRAYPGRPDGSLTEKTAYGIVQLIKKENVNVAFDLHEAAPEIPIINAIVYHEKAEEVALNAIFELEMEGISVSPELSPSNFHGLSHREWGDYTDVYPFLMETSNPIQGRLRGETSAELIVEGVSPEYRMALESGALQIAYKETGEPIERRVARHVTCFRRVIEAYNQLGNKPVILENLPEYEDILQNGVGAYIVAGK
ncbi:MAG: succinylglutamate desuccinylase [Candidatus Latescibacteria bacterium]|nr:succinylglutamate desuccinylase [bacterium]MBD3424642.1 succinylglutamate desuccinylase [Candidatus Latescibacterota bacterium]